MVINLERSMNALYLAVMLTAALSKSPPPAGAAESTGAAAVTGKKDTTITQYRLRYDHKVLRIPGQSIPIGILTQTAKGDTVKTKGYLQGDQGWSKYKLEVE